MITKRLEKQLACNNLFIYESYIQIGYFIKKTYFFWVATHVEVSSLHPENKFL